MKANATDLLLARCQTIAVEHSPASLHTAKLTRCAQTAPDRFLSTRKALLADEDVPLLVLPEVKARKSKLAALIERITNAIRKGD